jgi:zinc protease
VTLEEAEAGMDAAIAAFIEEGPDADHLARIKTQIRAAEIFALDNQEQLARRYGSALTQGLTIEDVQNWPSVLDAVQAEDLVAAAQKVFKKENSVTGWLSGLEKRAKPAAGEETSQ